MRDTTFIYVLNDPRDGRIRYVGKANNPYKRWIAHIATARTNDHRGHWISSLLALGLKPELEILEEIPMVGWQGIEKEYVRVFRMVNMNLTNSTGGGDGGFSPSPETRAKISNTKKNPSEEARSNMRAGQLGRKASPEARLNMRAAQMGNKNSLGNSPSLETRAKLSAARMGNKNSLGHSPSLETRAKMSAAHVGNKYNLGKSPSLATREKIRAAHTGRTRSPETRAKMSAARLAYLQEKKEAI